MNSSRKIFGALLLVTFGVAFVDAPNATASGLDSKFSAPSATMNFTSSVAGLGTIRGFVRDENGNPIAGAIIALFRDGAANMKQVRSTASGAFTARVAPGRYTLTAMADGFSVVSLPNVEVERAEEVAFRFNLVRVGSGNTLPERRADRNDPKWRARSNRSNRAIFQQNEGTGETLASVERIEIAEKPKEELDFSKRGQSYAETFFASSANPNGANYMGLNFATIQPINENFDLIIAGQTGFGNNAPNRLETTAKFKIGDAHRVSLNASGANLGTIKFEDETEEKLGQLSFQAIDEWRVRDDVIVVLGFDYSRFVGASNADSISPRFGLQFDANSKTRFNVAYTTQTEPRTWTEAAELEDARVLFREPNFESYVVSDGEVLMPRLRRFELGIERVLDNSSNIEATAFFDLTNNRGISFITLPVSGFNGEPGANEFSTAIQNGSAQGVRLVYSRRFNGIFSTNIGYAFGRGQQLSSEGLTNPANLFEDALFQTLSAQLVANFGSGTQVRTVWRYTPRGAVFAIDPFAGRMSVSEPTVSIFVTQKLPTWGLPVRARAMLDARNLFDFQTATANGENALRLNSTRRILRGGIALRF